VLTLYHLWLDDRREQGLCAAFDGRVWPALPGFVAREALEAELLKTMRCTTDRYIVVIGDHGTGKSTLVAKVATEMEGALYVFASEREVVKAGLCKDLVEALGGERPTAPLKQFWHKIMDEGEPTTSAIDDTLTNPPTGEKETNLDCALDTFERAAARFKLKNKRRAVLVVDNVNLIARKDLGLLMTLQEKAKFAADNQLYTVVFVCTDGGAPTRMKGKLRSPWQLLKFSADSATENSAWSRAREFRVGDMSIDEAMEYLREGRQQDPALARRIIEFCGTRVTHLQDICNYLQLGAEEEGSSSARAALFLL
jgi:DNA replicative helicase MCM subunit Mcm2 (Cdc46/Mcm family)